MGCCLTTVAGRRLVLRLCVVAVAFTRRNVIGSARCCGSNSPLRFGSALCILLIVDRKLKNEFH